MLTSAMNNKIQVKRVLGKSEAEGARERQEALGKHERTARHSEKRD
jgi:hypothetical protein